jgi:hypothetical protein
MIDSWSLDRIQWKFCPFETKQIAQMFKCSWEFILQMQTSAFCKCPWLPCQVTYNMMHVLFHDVNAVLWMCVHKTILLTADT